MKNSLWPPRPSAFTLELIKQDFRLAHATASRMALQHIVEPIRRGANTEAAVRLAARTRWLRAVAALSFWAVVSACLRK